MYALIGMSATPFEQSYGKALRTAMNSADREVLADEEVMKLFLAASRECFRQGAEGLVVDATLLYDAWPFDMTRVQRPVHFWQGSADTLVPEVINQTVAEKTPGASWHPISGGGHFIALSHANDILALAANDLGAAPNWNSDQSRADVAARLALRTIRRQFGIGSNRPIGRALRKAQLGARPRGNCLVDPSASGSGRGGIRSVSTPKEPGA